MGHQDCPCKGLLEEVGWTGLPWYRAQIVGYPLGLEEQEWGW